jgi:membrane fusion protein (multidrug efflux system)
MGISTSRQQIAAQVSGPVSQVAVQQFQQVKSGQILFRIDPEPFRLAVNQAADRLAQAQQAHEVKSQEYAQAEAVIKQRQANYQLAQHTVARYKALSQRNMIAKATLDQANSDLVAAKSALMVAYHQRQLVARQLHGLSGEDPQIKAAEVALEQAKLDLAHTLVRAPAAGQVVKLTLRKGSMVTAQQPLFSLVETGNWWVTANFKETQMARIKPGQPAEISVDLLPGEKLAGQVASGSRGRGQSFSLLPSENATGNWVKVTQRFPVRIKLIQLSAAIKDKLRDGASAQVVVNTTSRSE